MNVLRRAVALFVVSVTACGGGDATAPEVKNIAITSVPVPLIAGQPFTLVAEMRNSKGAVVTDASGSVTLSLEGGEGIAFGGPKTVVLQSGVATFSDLTITQSAGGLMFVATSGESNGSTAFFGVTAAAPSPSASRLSPPSGNIPPTGFTLVSVDVRDVYGNPVSGAAVTMSSTMPGATFSQASGATSGAGEFSTLFVPGTAGPVSVSASVNGVAIPAIAAFTAVDLCAMGAMPFPGSIEGTQPCGDYGATSFSAARYTLTSTGGAARIAVDAGFTPVIALTSAVGSNDIFFLADPAGAAVEWLLPAGAFTFYVGTNDYPGWFTITGTAIAAEYHQNIRVLASTGTYTGQALSTPDFRFEFGIRADRYMFRAPGPCTFTLQSDAFDPHLIVYDIVTGAVLASTQQPVSTPAVIQRASCRGAGSNPLMILIRSSGGLGAYTLTVEQPPLLRAATGLSPIDRGPPIPLSVLTNPPPIGR